MPYTRPILIGATIGSIAAALFFGLSQLPQAVADEQPLKTLLSSANDLKPALGFDPDALVKIGDETYSITADASVSFDPKSTRTVVKIAHGRKTVVTVATTPSGVYSSDAIVSPHIRYPGITVERIPAEAGRDGRHLAYWSQRRGWVPSPALSAGSFVLVTPIRGGAIIRTPQGNCVLSGNAAFC